MAKETMESAYQASPEKLASYVPNDQEVSQEEIDFIRQKLLPMDNSALDNFFKERGLSPDEQQSVKDVLSSMRTAPQQVAPEEQDIPKEVAGTPGEGYYTNAKPSDILQNIGGFSGDLLIGGAADVPAGGVALGTAALLRALRIPRPIAQGVGAGVGAAATGLGLTEGTENFVRETLGLDPVEYTDFMTGLSMLGPIFGAFGTKVPVESKELSKQAAKGALTLRNAATKLGDKLADAKGLTGKDKVDFIKLIDETMDDRISFYTKEGFSQDVAARKALEDIPLLQKAENYVNNVLETVPDVSQAKFEQEQFGSASFEQMERMSKGRMTTARENLNAEVTKGIELAKKGKVSYETARALQIPQSEVLADFERLLTDAVPSLPSTADGKSVIFSGGQFKVKSKNGVLRAFNPKEYKEYFNYAINNNDYLKTLVNYYTTVSKFKPQASVRGGVARVFPATSQTLGAISELRAQFAKNFPIDASTAAGDANRRAYSVIKSLEDKYVSVLENSEIPSLVSAAKDYRISKEMSFLAESSFRELSNAVTADPLTMGNAILKMKNSDLEKFVALKRGEAALSSQVINEDLPQYMARMVLESKFGNKLFTKGGVAGIPTRERLANIPKVLEEIVADKNLNLKMKTLLGADTWKSMLSDLKKASDIFTETGMKMVLAREKGNSKLASLLQDNIATKMLQLINPVSSTGFKGSLRSMLVIKQMVDHFGDSVIRNKVNQVVYSKYLPEVVNALNSPRMAAAERDRIIAAFGKDTPVGMSVLNAFDQMAQTKLFSLANTRKMILFGQAKNLAGMVGEGREPGVPSGQPQRGYQ